MASKRPKPLTGRIERMIFSLTSSIDGEFNSEMILKPLRQYYFHSPSWRTLWTTTTNQALVVIRNK